MKKSHVLFSKAPWLTLLLTLFFLSGLAQNVGKPLQVSNETFGVLKRVSRSSLANGKVLLSVTTHQDLGWIDEIEKCEVMRDTLWLTPYLNRLSSESNFEMDVEQASIIQEYILRHPDRKAEITKRLKEGRMLIGATYNQPYEEMYFSESLARELYLGKLWLKEEFDGYNATTYYNSDVPGRTPQVPQLMAKAGVDNMFISRHKQGVFDWYSPDGSKVTTYSPGHYIDFYNILGKDDETALRELAEQALIWSDGYNNVSGENKVMPAVLNFEFIWDQTPVQNLGPFMKFWNNLETVENEEGERLQISLPTIEFSTLDKFFGQIRQSTGRMPSIRGERPNVWIYIHGPSHHRALDHSRKADVLLPAAEKFAAAHAMVEGSWAKYPVELFDQAWESKIYPDHGWGGKGGQSTDDIFLMRFADAHEKAKRLLDQSTRSLASEVQTNNVMGTPVVVFNSLSWDRTSLVTCKVNFESGQARSVRVLTAGGKEIPVQLEKVEKDRKGYLQSADITFVAEDVPSIGFDTYYLSMSENQPAKPDQHPGKTFENDFYKARLSDGGISSLYDKELGKELVDASFFKAGEVFTMQSEGNGAGEFDAIQQPGMEDFDKTGYYDTQWQVTEKGPVFTSYKLRQPIRHAVAELEITFYHQVKKIDFDVALKNWDGTMFREFRMALPLNMQNGQVAYEVPFGVTEVGKDEIEGAAGERYQVPCEDLHPRGIENWINTSGNGFGVTLSSSVVGMDYLDPTDRDLNNTILQPILLASRRSCHGEGNDYHQTGHHHYSFSITSHRPGWKNGVHFGKEANEKLFAVTDPEKYAGAKLKERTAFLKVEQDNIIVTAMKKAENENSLALRYYNLDGKKSAVDLSFWKTFDEAYHTNLIEEIQGRLNMKEDHLQLDAGKYEIETIMLK